LLSLLTKLRGGILIDEETYLPDWDDALAIPIWATRYRKQPKLKRRLAKATRALLARLRAPNASAPAASESRAAQRRPTPNAASRASSD
jgi:hypothetical protein